MDARTIETTQTARNGLNSGYRVLLQGGKDNVATARIGKQRSEGVSMANRPYPSFLIYLDDRGEFRWRYQASNTKIIADSGEGYKRLEDCEHGIGLVQASGESEIWEEEEVARRRR